MVAAYGTSETYGGFFYQQLVWDNSSPGAQYFAAAGITNTGNQGYTLPGSSTASVIQLATLSGGNYIPPGGLSAGRFAFRIDGVCLFNTATPKQCGAQCILASQCCATPNDCPQGFVCGVNGACVSGRWHKACMLPR